MKRSWVGVGVGAVGLVAVACGGGDEMAGDLLEDAGQLLRDAGSALADAGAGSDGSAHAEASETHEVTCTDALVRTVVSGGTTTRSIVRLAELVTSTSDITGVDVIVCGKEGSYPANETCPAGSTCTGTAVLQPGDCHSSSAYLEAGKVRAYCGSYGDVNGVAPLTSPRWKTARITIRR